MTIVALTLGLILVLIVVKMVIERSDYDEHDEDDRT
jgi:Tfp pilus assembly protein PilW